MFQCWRVFLRVAIGNCLLLSVWYIYIVCMYVYAECVAGGNTGPVYMAYSRCGIF